MVKMEMVTNGTYLATHAGWVSELFDTVTVSLDTADEAVASKIRPYGKEGGQISCRQAIAGMKILKGTGYSGDLQVASVLLPGRQSYLESLVPVFKEVQPDAWMISPYIDFRTGKCKTSPSELRQTLGHFAEICEPLGVEVALSDEFSRITDQEILQGIRENKFILRSLGKEATLVRLSPDLTLQVGEEVYNQIQATERKWNPDTDKAEDFLDQALHEHGIHLRPQTSWRRWWGELGRSPKIPTQKGGCYGSTV